jgi:hypothetical protein
MARAGLPPSNRYRIHARYPVSSNSPTISDEVIKMVTATITEADQFIPFAAYNGDRETASGADESGTLTAQQIGRLLAQTYDLEEGE